MTRNTPIRMIALLLLLAVLLGMLPAVFAADMEDSAGTGSVLDSSAVDAEAVSSFEEDSLPEDYDSISVDSSLEDAQEDDDSWDFDDDWDGPCSDDGAPLTRNEVAACASATAIGKTDCVTFPQYTSPTWYCNRYYTDGTHKYGHYFYASAIAYHSMDDEPAYCIEPNTTSIAGASYSGYSGNSASSTSYWMYELDATQRCSIQKILAFGYPNRTYGYSWKAEYAATQVLIWEVIMRQRYADIQNCSDYGLYYAVKKTLGDDLYYPYMAILDAISTGISNGSVPSFSGSSSPSTVNLTFNKATNCYEATATDANGVLSYFTFSYPGVTFSKSGSSLSISVPADSIDNVAGQTITGTSSQLDMDTSNPTIWENSTYQTVLTNGGASTPKAYLTLSYTPPAPETGTLKLIKRVSDSSIGLDGWSFTIQNDATGASVTRTTDSAGNITVSDLEAGTYTVTEQAVSGYVTQPAQTVTLQPGSTSTVTFTNTPLTGGLTVQKSVNYGSLKGFQFRLHGTSTIGKNVDVTVSTNSSGVAAFTGIYVGTYTLEELDPGNAYLPVRSKTVTISADSITGTGSAETVSFTNTYKYWHATVTKVDANGATAQGDATLDGAEYTLYRNGTAVKTYTIQNGSFTTDSYPCTESDAVYTLKETKAPIGYQLDTTVYPLKTSYSHYSEADNHIALTVSDQVSTGKIQVSKYAQNQVAGTQQPEAGAIFRVWLKSAGSYDKAKDFERDMITVGKDSKGTSKDLPYGTYCLQQVSGWTGYDLDETIYEAAITEHGKTVTADTSGNQLELYNNIWTGKLTIRKVDGDTQEPLANAMFTLTGSDGSKQVMGTDGSGTVFFENLVYGVTYTWTETASPHGYLLDESSTGTWTVSKHDDSITVTCENKRWPGSISVIKQDANGSSLPGCTFLLEYYDGSQWKPVVSRANDVIAKGYTSTTDVQNGQLTTDAQGTVTYAGLWADGETKYRLTEISAPDGYELLSEPVFEGVIPAEYPEKDVTLEPDETENGTAYFYDLTFTVKNNHIYTLPLTGGRNFSFVPLAMLLIAMGAFFFVRYGQRKLFHHI